MENTESDFVDVIDLTDCLTSVLKRHGIPEDLYFAVLDLCCEYEDEGGLAVDATIHPDGIRLAAAEKRKEEIFVECLYPAILDLCVKYGASVFVQPDGVIRVSPTRR